MNIFTRGAWCGFLAASLTFQFGLANATPAIGTKEESSPQITLPLEGKETPASFKTPPSEEEIWRDYPKLANMMGLPGVARVTCDVEADGTINQCVVQSEVPAGLGFGAAALQVVSGLHMNPATVDGAPVKAKYTVSIRFKAPETSKLIAASLAQLPVSDAKMALASRMINLENFRLFATQNSEAVLERENQELEWSGRPPETQAAMDAYRQGFQDALADLLDRKVRKAATQMTEADLATAVAFLESSAGQAWLTLNRSADAAEAEDFQSRISDAARKRYCMQVQCELTTSPTPANVTSRR